jgi:hypothetical protein
VSADDAADEDPAEVVGYESLADRRSVDREEHGERQGQREFRKRRQRNKTTQIRVEQNYLVSGKLKRDVQTHVSKARHGRKQTSVAALGLRPRRHSSDRNFAELREFRRNRQQPAFTTN